MRKNPELTISVILKRALPATAVAAIVALILCALAALAFSGGLSVAYTPVVGWVVTVLSAAAAGYCAMRMCRGAALLCGAAAGAMYYVLLLIVGLCADSRATAGGIFIRFGAVCAAAVLGSLLAARRKKRYKSLKRRKL